MSATATSFNSDAAEGTLRQIIRYKPDGSGKKELVHAHWGTNPRFSAGIEYRFVRSEGQTFPAQRCLVPASEFRMKVNLKEYRVTLDDGNFFYLAGLWEPAMAGWPLSFKIITVYAGADVGDYQERHGAIILRRQVMQWLDRTVPESDLLIMPPAHTFFVEEIGHSAARKRGAQRQLEF